MHIIQYLPGFVDGDPEELDFETTEELLAIPWVAKWNNTLYVDYKFERFEKSESNTPNFDMIVCILFNKILDKEQSFILGFVDEESFDRIDLPIHIPLKD